jgi:hypothetical protein
VDIVLVGDILLDLLHDDHHRHLQHNKVSTPLLAKRRENKPKALARIVPPTAPTATPAAAPIIIFFLLSFFGFVL